MTASRERTLFVSSRTIPETFRLPYIGPDPSKLSTAPFELILNQQMLGGGQCRLTVSFDPKKGHTMQDSSWYTFWEAVVAINAMCIRNGQRGRWLSIGSTIGQCANRKFVSVLTALRRPSREH